MVNKRPSEFGDEMYELVYWKRISIQLQVTETGNCYNIFSSMLSVSEYARLTVNR